MSLKHPKCDSKMTYSECELTILRSAVDKADEQKGKRIVNSHEVQSMIKIVESFLEKKRLICYGGTAINALLPKQAQFYNKETDLADYDFFSTSPVEDAKELANIFRKNGFDEVEAKSGQHHGTYKVFVNFIGMADITYLHKDIYKELQKDAKKVDGIYYCPPNYLRMSMYLELSRPEGDVGRWEKVMKRLSLLNKYHPLTVDNCKKVDFQRGLSKEVEYTEEDVNKIYNTVRKTLVKEDVVFFGGFAISSYLEYMPLTTRRKIKKLPDFDVFSESAETTANIVAEQIKDKGMKGVKVVKKACVGEVISAHYQVIVGNSDTVAFIYEPMACHSYNKVKINKLSVKIATIDTMLSMYLAFLYSGRNYYDLNRILCMSNFLYKVQERNRLQQKGVLKRFSIDCYGYQETIEDMRAEKMKMYEELKVNKSSKDFEEWFLKYRPSDKKEPSDKKQKITKTPSKKKTVKKKTRASKKNKKNKTKKTK
jgi:hypothetical protein